MWAKELEAYVNDRVQRDEVSAVEGWSSIWLGNERDPLTLLIGRAQKLYDANAHYTAFITEFTRDELVELWNVCDDGITYSFDDEVYDALAQRYNHFEGGESS